MGSLANITDFASAFHKGNKHFWSCHTLEPGGTGAYAPASYLTHPTLKRHTIYTPHPRSLRPDQRLPVLVWANGMGLAWGLMFGKFLREIASHGYIVIASGDPGESGGTWGDGGGGGGSGGTGTVSTATNTLHAMMGRLHQADEKAMVDAARWAAEECAGCEDPDDVRAHVDGTRIALAGQSKGGLHAYAAAAALRDNGKLTTATATAAAIRTVGLFNSGLIFRTSTTLAQVRGLTVPVFYVIGGPADLAYKNAQHDWELLPPDLPAWSGNLDVGHMGTFYDDEHGGRFVRVALDWLDAMLNENGQAMRNLLEGYGNDGWDVRYRNM